MEVMSRMSSLVFRNTIYRKTGDTLSMLVRSIMHFSASAKCSRSKWNTPLHMVKPLHTSSGCMGLEEFFPKTSDIIEEGERAGSGDTKSGCRGYYE